MADVNGEMSVVSGLREDDERLDRVGSKALIGNRDLSDDFVILTQLSELEVGSMDDVCPPRPRERAPGLRRSSRVDHRR